MSEEKLPRATRRRRERLKKLSVKKQSDNLLWLLGRFPLDQTKDQKIDFAEEALDYATSAAILLFLKVPEIKARLEIVQIKMEFAQVHKKHAMLKENGMDVIIHLFQIMKKSKYLVMV